MAESLREKIEGLKQQAGNLHSLSDDKFVLPFMAFDLAIDKVLAILDEAMQEKESPDSKGWWWVVNEHYIEPVFLLPLSVVDKRLVCLHKGILKHPDKFYGKWTKAIIPNTKGDANATV